MCVCVLCAGVLQELEEEKQSNCEGLVVLLKDRTEMDRVLDELGPDRTGPCALLAKPGPDWTGLQKLGPDRTGPDRCEPYFVG